MRARGLNPDAKPVRGTGPHREGCEKLRARHGRLLRRHTRGLWLHGVGAAMSRTLVFMIVALWRMASSLLQHAHTQLLFDGKPYGENRVGAGRGSKFMRGPPRNSPVCVKPDRRS
jgi:hypothetical protein